MIKESKIDELLVSLNGSWISHLLASCQAELSIESEEAAHQTINLTGLSEAVKTTKKEEINAFSSKIIQAWMKTLFLGSNMHVMMQTLEEEDGTYHEYLHLDDHWEQAVVVIVKNWTTALFTINKGIKVDWVVATNVVPQVDVALGTLEKLDEMQGVKMLTGQRMEALFQHLDLSRLEEWSAKNQAAACILLAEYHDIFSLEPGELGCTALAKHEIKVIDDESFKESSRETPIYGGWGPCTHEGDVGSWCYMPKSEPMV